MKIGKPNVRKYYKQRLQLQGHYIIENGEMLENSLVGASLNYGFKYSKRVHSVNASLSVDYYDIMTNTGGIVGPQTSDLMNLGAEIEYTLQYWDEKNKTISIRAFLGSNLFYNGNKSNRYGFALGGQTGTQDVTYDQYMFGRNKVDGLWGNQRLENHGGFKTNSAFGVTNGTMFATNIYAELPYIPLIGCICRFWNV